MSTVDSDEFFVDVEVETDTQTLADQAVAILQAKWPDWEPNDADMEVILIEAMAPMAQNAADVASRVPAAIFRSYGVKILGEAYDDGTPATAVTTWTMVDNAGYTVPAGSEITIDGYTFRTTADFTVAALSTVQAGVVVEASEAGEDYNGLAGSSVQLLTDLASNPTVVVTTASSGGTEPETDADYQERLARKLLLQAVTLVTTRDFELMALDQTEIGRAIAANGGTRTVTVTVAKADGEVVSAGTKTALAAVYDLYKQVNTVVTIQDPTYTTIAVTYQVHMYPGFASADVIARCTAALQSYLSPANFGTPTNTGDPGSTTWYNETRVRKNKIIDLLGDVEGVDYVGTVTISGSAGATDAPTGDWVLAGTYPLTRAGTMTGSTI